MSLHESIPESGCGLRRGNLVVISMREGLTTRVLDVSVQKETVHFSEGSPLSRWSSVWESKVVHWQPIRRGKYYSRTYTEQPKRQGHAWTERHQTRESSARGRYQESGTQGGERWETDAERSTKVAKRRLSITRSNSWFTIIRYPWVFSKRLNHTAPFFFSSSFSILFSILFFNLLLSHFNLFAYLCRRET